ncbi:hypothetical protein GUY44_11255 [Pimelobacter simplex]|uniref:Uncharacterized protein n=1 Tax=Nocardioides simplex TaxID=2045 RepID=A0A0A1DFN5_NOCSI|nr:hypothetical protein [Pimelobacter simplex]AIY16049.1 hypothetical protein KR76_03440 [Pimelobacter simplex]MCG8151057.1 hypothetical protein [Pimelobacter simplex]GEB12312.1 hypothetical protein NSI01_06270 [Pimelobacter simplex]SFM96753.1 hypothetical protein SAMN05421671_4419 [Pimelobacter simplex]
MSTLLIPAPRAGANVFATDAWWDDVASDEPGVVREPGVVEVRRDDLPWDGQRTLLVLGQITELLAEPTVAAIEAWAAEVRALAAQQPGSVHLALSLSTPRALAELVTLARGHRWPPFDAGAAARYRRADPVPVPPTPGGQRAVSAFVDALLEQVEVQAVSGWATAADATADATACLSRSLDADPDVSDDLALALRAAGRAALTTFEDAGLTLSGPRDALLWPVSAVQGRIPIDVIADAAVEAMIGQRERPAEVVR